MRKHEKAAVPVPSAPTDGEQPISRYTPSISELSAKDNPQEPSLEEIYRRINDPAYLPTVSMRELFDTVYESRPPIIDGMLHTGTYLFVGAPKVGKSFFVVQLAYHVSTGIPLWEYPVNKGTVLYLALEDDHRRLQQRLYQMFGTDSAEDLYFAVCSKQLGSGLEEQLQKFVRERPGTKLIIIDTLQKIRAAGDGRCSYANDYQVITRLKDFADQSKLCLLLVHHTRKQQADDRFDMISGTNGLLGAADGAFLLQKEKRTDNTATLDISGRDQQDQRLYLSRDTARLIWRLERMETELWKPPPDPILDAVAGLVTEERPTWEGTPAELVSALGLEVPANILTRRLNPSAGRLLGEYGIQYDNTHTRSGAYIRLRLLREEQA